jgi:hypothetical protein
MKRHEWLISAAAVALMLAYDPTQSTGPGTVQDSQGSTSTQRGAGVDSKSSKNEDSGSATGAVRERSQTGSESGDSHGSARPNDSGRSLKESGAGTTSGTAKTRK